MTNVQLNSGTNNHESQNRKEVIPINLKQYELSIYIYNRKNFTYIYKFMKNLFLLIVNGEQLTQVRRQDEENLLARILQRVSLVPSAETINRAGRREGGEKEEWRGQGVRSFANSKRARTRRARLNIAEIESINFPRSP